MAPKEKFLSWKEWEFNVTLKVLNALPKGQEDYRPHERSRSAKELAFALANEELVNKEIVAGRVDFAGLPKMGTESWDEVIALLKKNYQASVDAIKSAGDADLMAEATIDFAGHKSSKIDALWSMLFDHVHHRGQFSVYLRLAGGKVPSIYGPSADDPGV